MVRPLATIEQEIRALSTSDKEALLHVLWEELDGPANPQVDAAWLEEAQQRSAQIDAGEVKPVPAEQVFSRLRSKLSK